MQEARIESNEAGRMSLEQWNTGPFGPSAPRGRDLY